MQHKPLSLLPLVLVAALACRTSAPPHEEAQARPVEHLPDPPTAMELEQREIASDQEPLDVVFSAWSVGDRLLLSARGRNTTVGFDVGFTVDPDGTPRLRNAPPTDIATQVLTPFEVAAWYPEREGIPVIDVRLVQRTATVLVRIATRLGQDEQIVDDAEPVDEDAPVEPRDIGEPTRSDAVDESVQPDPPGVAPEPAVPPAEPEEPPAR